MFFDEFVGEKVVPPSYSSAILGPLPPQLQDFNLLHLPLLGQFYFLFFD